MSFNAFLVQAGSWLVLEWIFYLQLKTQTNLFLSMEGMAFLEHQLGNLLDTVPDKVLICPKVRDGFPSRAYYSNQKMHEFFGQDPTLPVDRKPEQIRIGKPVRL